MLKVFQVLLSFEIRNTIISILFIFCSYISTKISPQFSPLSSFLTHPSQSTPLLLEESFKPNNVFVFIGKRLNKVNYQHGPYRKIVTHD